MERLASVIQSLGESYIAFKYFDTIVAALIFGGFIFGFGFVIYKMIKELYK